MPLRRHRNAVSLATRNAELALAAPQVIAHRMARMAAATYPLSARDQKEFHGMGAEKLRAFADSWQAMALQAVRANQTLAAGMLKNFWVPCAWGRVAVPSVAQLQNAALGVLSKGLAPVHRKATSNARRLAGTKLR